jgi:microcystin-dependent protein
MQRIRGTTTATSLPPVVGTGTIGYFQEGNPSSGQPATIVTQEFLNTVQEELCNAITGAGIALNDSSRNQLYTAITTIAGSANTLPSGTILDFSGGVVPTGYLACDGSAISRTTYSALFTACGTAFGSGNGSTTFNLPDTRGKVLMGSGSGPGLTPRVRGQNIGTETHTLTITEIPAHTHDYSRLTVGGPIPTGGSQYSFSDVPTSSTGGGGAHNNMQPSLVVTQIIKI